MPPPPPKWMPPEGTQCQVCLDLSWEKVMEEPLLVMLVRVLHESLRAWVTKLTGWHRLQLCPTHKDALIRAREKHERHT